MSRASISPSLHSPCCSRFRHAASSAMPHPSVFTNCCCGCSPGCKVCGEKAMDCLRLRRHVHSCVQLQHNGQSQSLRSTHRLHQVRAGCSIAGSVTQEEAGNCAWMAADGLGSAAGVLLCTRACHTSCPPQMTCSSSSGTGTRAGLATRSLRATPTMSCRRALMFYTALSAVLHKTYA